MLFAFGTGTYDEPEFNDPAAQPHKVRELVAQSLSEVVAILYELGYASDPADYRLDLSRADISPFLRKASGAADMVIIYYTGHGEHRPPDDFYLCTKDFRRSDLPENGYKTRDLPGLIVSRGANELPLGDQSPTLLILDCCFAGAAGSQTALDAISRRGSRSPTTDDRR
jgi:hypothetical protein